MYERIFVPIGRKIMPIFHFSGSSVHRFSPEIDGITLITVVGNKCIGNFSEGSYLDLFWSTGCDDGMLSFNMVCNYCHMATFYQILFIKLLYDNRLRNV